MDVSFHQKYQQQNGIFGLIKIQVENTCKYSEEMQEQKDLYNHECNNERSKPANIIEYNGPL